MTRPVGAGTERKAGTPPFRDAASPAPAAPLGDDAQRLLVLLRSSASAEQPITQLEAGERLGLEGGKDTVRRRVQHLRDEITSVTGQVICSSWGSPPGMWLPESKEQEDRYIGTVLKRAFTTIEQFKGLERERREKIVQAVQGVLALDDTAKAEKNRARSAQASVGLCKQCHEPMEIWRRDRAFCSDHCRMIWHGRKKAS